ncbi:hypothetical protein [Bdellovibrio bacteriovorus]|uniref:Uncharacterized protein n=1 Tax=Bdellovibrio bacteriovorus str. Tiberius TaxID=1069642 RepID=K7ZF45_BDEBC|nr:hypothetical protein [Bdellovibrio bacteriovorus]AFY01147.1 Hypothetical protein Bdt_1449 [Bdellovibrio bacteriovorus str. Tiberius]
MNENINLPLALPFGLKNKSHAEETILDKFNTLYNNRAFSEYIKFGKTLEKEEQDAKKEGKCLDLIPDFHRGLLCLFQKMLENINLQIICDCLEKDLQSRQLIYDIVNALQVFRSPYFGEMFGEYTNRRLVNYVANKNGDPRLFNNAGDVKPPKELNGIKNIFWYLLRNLQAPDSTFRRSIKNSAYINEKMKNEIINSFKVSSLNTKSSKLTLADQLNDFFSKDKKSQEMHSRILANVEQEKFRLKHEVIADILNWRFNLDMEYDHDLQYPKFKPLIYFSKDNIEVYLNPRKK